jgi:hypothetical protein
MGIPGGRKMNFKEEDTQSGIQEIMRIQITITQK